VPPDGKPSKKGKLMATVDEHNAFWRQANGCKDKPSRSSEEGDVRTIEWTACKSGTVVRSIFSASLAHRWPRKKRDGFDGATALYAFFLDR